MPWLGMEDCRHYGGVKMITAKVCCGGRRHEKVKLKCAVHKHVYSDTCRKDTCGYYEKGEGKCQKKG
jgi:hypothetical protein